MTAIEKGRKIESITRTYEEEKSKFDTLKEVFEDDMQRFLSKKNDMESLQFVGSEELTHIMESVAKLHDTISAKNQKKTVV